MSEATAKPLLICEKLHLLLLDASGGLQTVPAYRAYGETAALLVDLASCNGVAIAKGDPPVLTARQDVNAPAHPVLRAGWAALKEIGSDSFAQLIQRPELDPEITVVESLRAHRLLEPTEHAVLGFHFNRDAVIDATPKEQLLTRLVNVIAGSQRATVQDLTLLALVNATADARRVLGPEMRTMTQEQFSQRMRDLHTETLSADAVSDAVHRLALSTIAAVIMPTSISGVL